MGERRMTLVDRAAYPNRIPCPKGCRYAMSDYERSRAAKGGNRSFWRRWNAKRYDSADTRPAKMSLPGYPSKDPRTNRVICSVCKHSELRMVEGLIEVRRKRGTNPRLLARWEDVA